MVIDGEGQLSAAASTYGWGGNGSSSNPYVIEDMVIDGTGSPWCLRLLGISTSHVVVRNNRFHNATGDSGVNLQNSSLSIDGCVNVSIINNTVEDNPNFGICVLDSTALITNNRIRSNRYGLYIDSDDACIIEGNDLTDNKKGVSARGPQSIRSNTIDGDNSISGFGLKCFSMAPDVASRNTITNVSQGLFVHERSNATAYDNNTFRRCTYGVWLEREGVTFDNNTFTDSDYAFYLKKGHCTFKGNVMMGAGITFPRNVEGIEVLTTHQIEGSNRVNGAPIRYIVDSKDITLDPKDLGQVIIANSSHITIANTSVSRDLWFFAGYCDNITLRDSTWRTTTGGLWVSRQTEDLLIHNNTIEGFSFEIEYEYYGSISNNHLTDSDMYLYRDYYMRITNNTMVTQGADPLTLSTAYATSVYDNDITLRSPVPGVAAIRLLSAGGSRFHNNSMTGAGFASYRQQYHSWAGYTIDETNTLSGRPILYLDRAMDQVIMGDYGQVIAARCNNVSIRNLAMDESHGGVMISNSQLVTIRRCTFSGLVNPAVIITGTGGIAIDDCFFQDGNSRVELVEVNSKGGEDYNKISHNYFINITPDERGPGAIHAYRAFINRMEGNLFRDIDGFGLAGNIGILNVTSNEFTNCSSQAVHGMLWWTDLFNNSFLDNGVGPNGSQCFDDARDSLWDNGQEGNHWSDYTSRYPLSSNDGAVWDVPYAIGGEYHLLDSRPLVQYVDRVPPLLFANISGTYPPFTQVGFSAHAIDNVGVVEYNWSFNRGGELSYLSGKSIERVFNESGLYTVVITVRDAAGNQDQGLFAIQVTDTIPPVARAGDDRTVVPGTTVTLDASASTDDRYIVTYNWTIEHDGEKFVLEGEKVQHTFHEEGVYNITLTVSDPAGNTATDTVVLTVGDFEPPVVFIGHDRFVPDRAVIQFSGEDSSDNWGIDSYGWTITSPGGEVATYDTRDISHIFVGAGVHTVTLRVTDVAGLWSEATINVTVMDETPPVAVAGEDAEVGQGEPLQLDGSASHDNVAVVNWTWTVTGPGDDVSLQGEHATHSFEKAGSYTVTLTVSDAWGNTASASFEVDVLDTEPPVADAGDDVSVEQGATVDLDASGSSDNVGIAHYLWTFTYRGEEVTRSDTQLSFAFDDAGEHVVTLSVSDQRGNTGTDTVTVTVRDTEAPVADAGPGLAVPQHQPAVIDPTNSSDNVGIVSWTWEFEVGGENLTLEQRTFEHTFDDVGDFHITLTVADAAGNTASADTVVAVLDADPPVAEAGPDITCGEGDTITLDGSTSTDNVAIALYLWTFDYAGEPVERSGERVEFTFDREGAYVVTLTVHDGNDRTSTDTVTVTVEATGDGPSDDGGLSVALVGGIIAAVAVAVLVALLMVRRRRG